MYPSSVKFNVADVTLGPLVMPLIAVLSMVCAGLRTFWKWLLVMLAFNPEG
jgi:hypothetical protein